MLCTAVLKETVSHCIVGGSNVYACLLDASKAFDKVHYGKLFTLLFNLKMSALFLRLIIDSYPRQDMPTKWNSCISNQFRVTNCTKQGGVLSPMLLAVYFDELTTRLKTYGIGCAIALTLVFSAMQLTSLCYPL